MLEPYCTFFAHEVEMHLNPGGEDIVQRTLYHTSPPQMSDSYLNYAEKGVSLRSRYISAKADYPGHLLHKSNARRGEEDTVRLRDVTVRISNNGSAALPSSQPSCRAIDVDA